MKPFKLKPIPSIQTTKGISASTLDVKFKTVLTEVPKEEIEAKRNPMYKLLIP